MSEFKKQQVKINAMYKRCGCGSASMSNFTTVGFSKKNQNKKRDSQNFKKGFNLPF